jgi:hypothetical protein
VRAELNELDQSFLFILDNVEKYENIDEFLKELCQFKSENILTFINTVNEIIGNNEASLK